MEYKLLAATGLLFLIGLAHSFLGEKFIVRRLEKRDLPKLFGSDVFTKRTIRFAWHLTTVAWWGFAALLVVILNGTLVNNRIVLRILAITFVISALFPLVFTRGKHLSWLVLLAVGLLCLLE